MLDKTNTQRQLVSWVGKALIASALILLGLVVWKASAFPGVNSELTVPVSLGPLRLIEIAKIKVDGGFAGTITYLPGLILYFTIFLISGALIALHQTRK